MTTCESHCHTQRH